MHDAMKPGEPAQDIHELQIPRSGIWRAITGFHNMGHTCDLGSLLCAILSIGRVSFGLASDSGDGDAMSALQELLMHFAQGGGPARLNDLVAAVESGFADA
jgi:hypothetical protein